MSLARELNQIYKEMLAEQYNMINERRKHSDGQFGDGYGQGYIDALDAIKEKLQVDFEEE